LLDPASLLEKYFWRGEEELSELKGEVAARSRQRYESPCTI